MLQESSLRGPSRQCPQDTQPRDTPVRINMKTRVRHFPCIQNFFLEYMQGVCLQFCPRQNLPPSESGKRARIRDVTRGVTNFKRTVLRKISLEVRRIDFDAANFACRAKPNDAPVVARTAASARLPAVMHSRRSARQNQVVAPAKEHVTRIDDQTAVLDCGEVDFLTSSFDRRPVR